MLEQARDKSSDVSWVAGCAEALPFGDRSFNGAIATLTIHHWKDLDKGFAEATRVLRSGGRLVVFTSDPEQMQGYWLCHYFPQMMERSGAVMPTLDRVMRAAEKAGLTCTLEDPYTVRCDLEDLFLYSGRHAPERYLDPHFRKGISSFALFSPPDELENGLLALADDIEQDRWTAVEQRYENSGGDYLHLVFSVS
jgi:SAM-dependent methyltransferase